VPTILIVVLMLASVTIIATTVPTLRIASIDPVKTLRDQWNNDAAYHPKRHLFP
jgi:ABC-type lipoprotein release transport system permease subunit